MTPYEIADKAIFEFFIVTIVIVVLPLVGLLFIKKDEKDE